MVRGAGFVLLKCSILVAMTITEGSEKSSQFCLLKANFYDRCAQFCLTLCDSLDHQLISMIDMLSCVWLFVTPPVSSVCVGFFRQKCCNGLPFLPLVDFLDPGIKPAPLACPTLQEDSLPLSHQGMRKWQMGGEKSGDFCWMLSFCIRHDNNIYKVLINIQYKLNWGSMVNLASERILHCHFWVGIKCLLWAVVTIVGVECFKEGLPQKCIYFSSFSGPAKINIHDICRLFEYSHFHGKSGCLWQIMHSELMVFSISKSIQGH